MKRIEKIKSSIRVETYKNIRRDRAIGNLILGGYIGSGLITGINPEQYFGYGILSATVLTVLSNLEKSHSENKANNLITRYKNAEYADTQLGDNIVPINIKASRKYDHKVYGLKEAGPILSVFGGVAEAGSYLITNNEASSPLFAHSIGAIALVGAVAASYAISNRAYEDTKLQAKVAFNSIDLHQSNQ